MMEMKQLKNILESAIFAAGEPVTIERLQKIFSEEEGINAQHIKQALDELKNDCENNVYHLKEVGSGYRFQVDKDFSPWLVKLWEEKPPKYSRAVLETLALVAYRQPVTRPEVEEIRGVSSSSHIFKTLLERDWIRVIGHKDVPGKPSLFATTKQFLDYFNLQSLEELPTLSEVMDLDKAAQQLELVVDNETENVAEVQLPLSNEEERDVNGEVQDVEQALHVAPSEEDTTESTEITFADLAEKFSQEKEEIN